MFDEFYPKSETMAVGPGAMWVLGYEMKLREHLQNAKSGDREAESKLCNRLGQLRRHYKVLSGFPSGLLDVLKETAAFLRSTGRKVDLGNPDPRFWITTRSGGPRW